MVMTYTKAPAPPSNQASWFCIAVLEAVLMCQNLFLLPEETFDRWLALFRLGRLLAMAISPTRWWVALTIALLLVSSSNALTNTDCRGEAVHITCSNRRPPIETVKCLSAESVKA